MCEIFFTLINAGKTFISSKVLEGQALTFTPEQFAAFSSLAASRHQIVYTITRPLGPDDGSLFHIDSPGLELNEFTQFDIDNFKIIYLPPFVSIGPEEKFFSFKFTGNILLMHAFQLFFINSNFIFKTVISHTKIF